MSKYTMPDDNQLQNNGQASFTVFGVGGGFLAPYSSEEGGGLRNV